MKKRIVFLTLTLLWMGLIFWFSSKTATDSTKQSISATEWLLRFFVEKPDAALVDGLENFVRKAAHFTEYFILGGLVFGTVQSFGNKRK